MSQRAILILATAVLAAATACSSDDGSAPPRSASDGTTTASSETPSPAPTPSATPTPAPKPTPKPTPQGPKAADGSNLQACSDAKCEVLVKTGSRVPVKAGVLGFPTLKITKVSAGGVDFAASSSCCSVSGGGSVGGIVQLNALKITVVAVTGKSAIIRLSRA